MRIAIIDLGTNTFNLLIADKKNSTFKTVFKTKIAVKLGEGGIDKGIIAQEPYKRGIEALETHLQTIRKYNIDTVRAFATSAIRSSKNGQDFVKEVYEKLHLNIEVIDGDKEAELIYQGVKNAIDFNLENKLIMDIGGGSTEFIIANSEGVKWKKSYQLGVSRLKELFKPNDPISRKDIESIESHFDENLVDLFQNLKKNPCNELIGSSGSFDTIVEMIGHKFDKLKQSNKKPACFIEKKEYHWAEEYLLKSTLSERLNTDGIIKMRADMIVISAVFINYILRKTDINQIVRSKFALKEGAMNFFF